MVVVVVVGERETSERKRRGGGRLYREGVVVVDASRRVSRSRLFAQTLFYSAQPPGGLHIQQADADHPVSSPSPSSPPTLLSTTTTTLQVFLINMVRARRRLLR